MKPEPIDHLGRPRRRSHSSFWLLLQIMVGLFAGAASALIGVVLQQRYFDTLWLTGGPLIGAAVLALILLIMGRAGLETGYLVIMGSFALGMALLFAGFGLGLGHFLPF